MATKGNQSIDIIVEKIGELNVDTPIDLARVLSLYVKAYNDNGVVKIVSVKYIEGYPGEGMMKKFGKQFEKMHTLFLKRGVDSRMRHKIFKKLAMNMPKMPTTVKDMNKLCDRVSSEAIDALRIKRLAELRQGLVAKFKLAVKKYLHLTYSLGFNEPSACAMSLIEHHKIDKYVMSGDFPLLLLPFLPRIESALRKAYENYGMVDAWEVLNGRYFAHKEQFLALAVEIKSTFNRAIPNFEEYFDQMYTDTYYRVMLKTGNKR